MVRCPTPGGAWGDIACEQQSYAMGQIDSTAGRIDDIRIRRTRSTGNGVQQSASAAEISAYDLKDGFGHGDIAQSVGGIVERFENIDDGILIRSGRGQSRAPIAARGKRAVVPGRSKREAVDHIRSEDRPVQKE